MLLHAALNKTRRKILAKPRSSGRRQPGVELLEQRIVLDSTDFLVSVSNATTLGQPVAASYAAPWILAQENIVIQGFDKQQNWESGDTKLNYLETWSFVASGSTGLADASDWVVNIAPAPGGPPLPQTAYASLGNYSFEVTRDAGGSYSIPLSQWDAAWWSQGNANNAFQLSVSPYDDTGFNQRDFGSRQLELFFTNDSGYVQNIAGAKRIRSSEFVGLPTPGDLTKPYTQWRGIADAAGNPRLAYFGGLANYLYLNGLTSDSGGTAANPGPTIEITIDADYETGLGTGAYNLSGEVAVFDLAFASLNEAEAFADGLNNTYWGKGSSTAVVPDTNYVSGRTQATTVERYLDQNKLTPPEVLERAGNARPGWSWYTLTTGGRLIVNGPGRMLGFDASGTYNLAADDTYTIWVDPTNQALGSIPLGAKYGEDPLYEVAGHFLFANSLYRSGDNDADAAIDMAGPTAAWTMRLGHGAVQLNVAPTYIGRTPGFIAQSGRLQPVPGEHFFQESPVKIYDYKQVAAWTDQADGPSWQGWGSVMSRSFIQASDDSIKLESVGSRGLANTVIQGAAGAAVGYGYSQVNGGVGALADGVYVHRIIHSDNSFAYDRGVVSVQIIPNVPRAFWNGPDFKTTVRNLYVPDLVNGDGKSMNIVTYGVTVNAGPTIRGFEFGSSTLPDGTAPYAFDVNLQMWENMWIFPPRQKADVWWVFDPNGLQLEKIPNVSDGLYQWVTGHNVLEFPTDGGGNVPITMTQDSSLSLRLFPFAGFAGSDRPPVDLNGDGVGDVVWHNETENHFVAWFYDAQGQRIPGADRYLGGLGGWELEVVGEFDASPTAVSDLVWRERSTGATFLWIMNPDGTPAQQTWLGGDLDWRVEASGDYNGDGFADLIWRQASSGASFLSLMEGVATISTSYLGGDQSWRLVPTAANYDANGDLKTDLIWNQGGGGTNVVHLMNGGTTLKEFALDTPAGGLIAATGNFNLDEFSDLIWHWPAASAVTPGRSEEWLMGPTDAAQPGRPVVSQNLAAPTGREPIQTASFWNNDLVWLNLETGRNAAWTMQGFEAPAARRRDIGGDQFWRLLGRDLLNQT